MKTVEIAETDLNKLVSQMDIVDYDDDRSVLRDRISANYPNVIVLVRKVKPDLPGPIRVRSPKIGRFS